MRQLTTCLITNIITIVICITGDMLLDKEYNNHLIKALIDNATHSGVGLTSGFVILYLSDRKHLSLLSKCFLILCCTFISSFIDLDHFIAARSFQLKVNIFKYSIIMFVYNYLLHIQIF